MAVEGGELAVWERPGADPPVVLVHGLGADAMTFAGAFEPGALPGRRLIAPDLPGHGSSPLADHPCTMGAFAETLLSLLGGLGVGRYDLVAHSMGGAVGIVMAERSAVGTFVDAEGNLAGENCFFSGPVAAMDRDRFLREGRVRFLGKVGHLAARGSACWRYYTGALARCDPDALHRSARGLVDASANAGLLERYVALGCRTLYVVGSANAASFPGRERLAEAGREVQVVPGGHFMVLDSPAEFYAAVRRATRA